MGIKKSSAKAEPDSIGKTLQDSRRERAITQEQLAQLAGVPYTTLTKVESGAIRNPSSQVVSKLAKALGISLDTLFAPAIYQGAGSVENIFADVLQSDLQKGDYMCISGIDEKIYLEKTPAGVTAFVSELKKRGISQKLLCCEGDTNFLEGDHIEYRWIPEKYFSSVPTYVYGNKIAILIWGPPQRAMIVENEHLAEAYRRQFLFLWEHAKVITTNLRKRSNTRKP